MNETVEKLIEFIVFTGLAFAGIWYASDLIVITQDTVILMMIFVQIIFRTG